MRRPNWGVFVLVRDMRNKTQNVEWYKSDNDVLCHYEVESVLSEVQKVYNKPHIECAIIDAGYVGGEAELAVELERLRVMWRKRGWD